MSDWAALCEGRTIGKRAVIVVPSGTADVFVPVNVFSLQAKDTQAIPISILLNSPQIVAPPAGGFPAAVQQITGETDNVENQDNLIWTQAIAEIEWGIGGVASKAIMDFENGSLINIQASYVRMRAILSAISGASAAAMVLSAFVGPAANPTSNPRFTDRSGSVNAGALGSVRSIPRFAKTLTPIANGALNVEVRFFRDRAATDEVGRVVGYTGGFPIVIPGAGAYYFRYFNNTGGVLIMRSIFTLAL